MEEGARELNDDGVLNQIFRLGGRIKLPWVGGPKNNVSKSLKGKVRKSSKIGRPFDIAEIIEFTKLVIDYRK